MSDAATKTCSKCGEVKAVEFFRFDRLICRECRRIDQKKRRQANPAKVAAINKKYRLRNMEKHAEWRKKSIRKRQLSDPNYGAERSRKNRQKYPERTAAEKRRRIGELRSGYVAERIAAIIGISSELIPDFFIEVKRKHLQILRTIKEMKK